MNIGHIDGNYYVSPQLSPDQMEEIANLGFEVSFVIGQTLKSPILLAVRSLGSLQKT